MSTFSELLRNKYFLLAAILTLVSIAYWTFYAVNAYNSFIYTSDLGFYIYNILVLSIGLPNIQNQMFFNCAAGGKPFR